ncbi:family 43 glycosylhydrolase [Plebeiibacterium sediminum]|uniref:Family 43 glycosylhydrolase n=1 Tax=Plebeiibacterium sediminum TaxID=2992112 RepID=A0AAE3M4R0_9BACT|nr:family 43 glycosylhydrolase [Plebeiobacterium sediminum]MCW3787013.1 family 43 glycosylhydrolase [Plebeiobacterium sediminum]
MKKTYLLLSAIVFAFLATLLPGCSCGNDDYSAYLFTYFVGNGPGEESIHYAVSADGYNYIALNNNEAIIDSKDISSSGGVRDPHILRGEDGKTFYMVITDLYVTDQGWNNVAMILMKSTDLINWEHSIINIPETYPETFGDVDRVWAPQTIYDEETQKYMVYFSMKQGNNPDIIYYAYANKDFTALESEPKQLYFSPTNNACIDGDIIKKDGKFYFFMKSETGEPGIKLAISDKLTEGYEMVSTDRVDCSEHRVEGSGTFKLNHSDEYILMYDVYIKGEYQFTKSSDLKHFEVVDHAISMNFHPRHGCVMPITQKELQRLMNKWGTIDGEFVKVTSEQVKKLNVNFNNKTESIHIPVKTGTDLTQFDPQFSAFQGISVSPQGAQDFSAGAVEYTITMEGQTPVTYTVEVSEDHNPVVEGYYADPDLIYSNKTKKYYMYPTSDGFNNWSGTYFKTFSSEDLVNWTDEGVILDLHKDVSWADRNAWAPCIIEKEVNGQYKYYYYYTAAQTIGVAVADDPAGPFVDSGKALIDTKPKGITRGQIIDPDVFQDPETGKFYLYWGNGFMVGAELNDDMVSIKEKTLTEFHPGHTFREGSHVLYRKGTYYFMWSEDDTRSPNYRVRYATATSPLGKLSIPENNIVVEKKPEQGIYATGHNTTIQVPGKDEWYLVYHRFTLPKGIDMGRPAGFHREVCIDKMEFNADGSIKPVIPTLKGIEPISK